MKLFVCLDNFRRWRVGEIHYCQADANSPRSWIFTRVSFSFCFYLPSLALCACVWVCHGRLLQLQQGATICSLLE